MLDKWKKFDDIHETQLHLDGELLMIRALLENGREKKEEIELFYLVGFFFLKSLQQRRHFFSDGIFFTFGKSILLSPKTGSSGACVCT